MNRPARRRSSYKTLENQQQQQQQPPQQPQPPSAGGSSSGNTHTGSAMDGANRKVELQSPEDLTYLITNVRRAAAEHIGAAFPPVEGDDAEEDELRVRIEALVNEYINQTFTLAAPNLSINGFDLDAKTFPAVYLSDPDSAPASASSASTRTRGARARAAEAATTAGPEVQYEPFDARRRARVEELAREEEDLMRDIAALKRRVPLAAAKGFADAFWDGVRADEEALAAARAGAAAEFLGGGGGGGGGAAEEEEGQGQGDEEQGAAAAGENDKNTLEKKTKGKTALLQGLGTIERVDDVERGYAGVVDTLGRLKRDMPATVAKMERARVAGEYVVTGR